MMEPQRTFTAGELAELLQVELRGDPSVMLRRLGSLEEPESDALGFAESARQAEKVERLGALIAPADAQISLTHLVSERPRVLFARAAALFYPDAQARPGIHPSASVSPQARIHPLAEVGPLCVVEGQAEIDQGAILTARVMIGAGARVGARARLFPGVVLEAGAAVGEDSLLEPHARLLAGATIGARVYLGAHATVRACHLGDGTKMDNLASVDEGSQIGPHNLLISKSQVSKRVATGPYTLVAAVSCVLDDVVLGPLIQVAGHSVVDRSWESPKLQLAGEPAQLLRTEMKERAVAQRALKVYQRSRAGSSDTTPHTPS